MSRRLPAYRVAVFGEPRAPWRDTIAEAKADGLDTGLASIDQSNGEVFFPVPAELQVTHSDVETESRSVRKKGPSSAARLSRIDRIIDRQKARKSNAF